MNSKNKRLVICQIILQMDNNEHLNKWDRISQIPVYDYM